MSGGTAEESSVTTLDTDSTATSGAETTHTIRPVPVDVIEFEDSLYRTGSAVMLPKKPIESEESSDSEEEGEQYYAGIDLVALLFRQFEFSPERRALVTGHTDSSGTPEYNFTLSRRRARGILYLVQGFDEDWARNCFEAHTVGCCKEILKYVHAGRRWPCNPGEINNTGNRDFERATESFVNSYNSEYARPNDLEEVSSHAITELRRDSRHRWPTAIWEAVYQIYEKDLREALGMTSEELETFRFEKVEFTEESHEYVGCSYSFPMAERYEEDYRSETDRRVEVIFFPEAQAPSSETLACPSEIDDLHTTEECRLWRERYLDRTYVDPRELHAVPYHLRFKYNNRVRKEQMDMPDGLRLRAKVGENEIPTRTIFNDGLYTAVVQFPNASEAETNANNVQLTWSLENRYVYTSGSDSTPQIVTKTAEEFAALSRAEQLKHYDIAAAWNTRNWRCKVGDTVDDWEHHVQTRTSGDSPIEINLDDIVLLTAVDGHQNVVDKNGSGTEFPLSKDDNATASPPQYPSRVRVLYVDPEDNLMKVHTTNASGSKQEQHDGSVIRFQTNHANDAVKNIIKDPPGGARAVVFCCELYDVTNKRTTEDSAFDFERGHVLGARAAILNDNSVHRQETIIHTDNTTLIHGPGIGDYIMHYLHDGGFDDSSVYSYLIVHWCGWVTKDTNPSNGTTARTTAPTDAQINEFRSLGMINAMEHWNKKQYELVPHEEPSSSTASPSTSAPTTAPTTAPTSDESGSTTSAPTGSAEEEANAEATPLTRKVRPFFFFEAVESFKLTPPTPAITFKTNTEDLFNHANFTTALTQSRGGRPRSIVFITEEDKGSWVRSWRYNNRFSSMSLRIKTRKDDAGRFSVSRFPSGVGFPFGEFNDPGGNSSYGCLVIAHELGHATGQIDDYEEDARYFGDDPPTMPIPSYGQFGVRTNNRRMGHDNSRMNQRNRSSEAFDTKHDDKTMMDSNGPIRMRHVWRFVHWMNQKAQSGQDLHDLLNGQRFEIRYPHPSPAMANYYRNGTREPLDPWQAVDSATINSATNRPMNVYLYKTLDEQMRVARSSGGNVDAKGVLVVRPLLSVAFQDVGTNTWTAAERRDWCRLFFQWFTTNKNVLPGKFMLSGGGADNDLEPTMIKFLPGCDFYAAGGNPSHNHQNLKVVVKRSADALSASGTTVTVGATSTRIKALFYYLFNKPANSTGFTTADFNFIRTWFNGRTTPGGSFNVVQM